jgi:hypothetical protein
MHRTELCFRALHHRIVWLEERQAGQDPSDEQVERVLRKILAEKFSGGVTYMENRYTLEEERSFVEVQRVASTLRPVTIDVASLIVEPETVPSKAYMETFRMLEGQLTDFPHIDLRKSPRQSSVDVKMNCEVKKPNSPGSV